MQYCATIRVSTPPERTTVKDSCRPTLHEPAVLTANVLSLNVCGLRSKLLLGDFVELIEKYDIVTLCETICDDIDMENVKDKFKDIGFVVVYKNKSVISRYKSGGLAIAIRENIKFK